MSVIVTGGAEPAHSTVDSWVEKTEFEPPKGGDFDKRALEEPVSWLNDERFWLYAAVDPMTTVRLALGLWSIRPRQVLALVRRELRVELFDRGCRMLW